MLAWACKLTRCLWWYEHRARMLRLDQGSPSQSTCVSLVQSSSALSGDLHVGQAVR